MNRVLMGLLLLVGCDTQAPDPIATPDTVIRLVGARLDFLHSVVDPFKKEMAAKGRRVAFPQFPSQAETTGVDSEIRILANRFPDIDLLFVKSHSALTYATKGWIQPLDQVTEQLAEPLRSDDLLWVDSASLRAYREQPGASSGLPCLPVYRSATFLIYWEDVLNEAGLSTKDIEQRARSLEGFADLLRDVRQFILKTRPEQDHRPALVLDGQNFYADFLSLVRSNGGNLPHSTDDQQQHRRTVETFEFLHGLIGDGLATPIGRMDGDFSAKRLERLSGFTTKQSPILLANADSLSGLRGLAPEEFRKLRLLPLPHARDLDRARSIRQDDVVVLNKASMHQDDAVGFVRHIARSRSLAADMEQSLLLPAVRKLPTDGSPKVTFLHRLAKCYEAMDLEIACYSPGIALLLEERLHGVFGEPRGKETSTPAESCSRINLRLEFEMSRHR